MDAAKCRALKTELMGQPEPQVLPVARFFDGNDDVTSIGCNLDPHPGIGMFRDILTGLLHRPGVQAVYVQVSELDPGEDYWPFSDMVLVVGSFPVDELRQVVAVLDPDEVAPADGFYVSPTVTGQHDSPVSVIWWD
jgi:hypothetical protein